MTPERLFDLAAEFAQATSNAERLHAHASTNDDGSAYNTDATSWSSLAASRREELRTALREALRSPIRAVPDNDVPVATWQRGRVEIRAITSDGTRTVRVRYTPAQAIAAGAALIACAAITDERSNGTLSGILATFPANSADNIEEPERST